MKFIAVKLAVCLAACGVCFLLHLSASALRSVSDSVLEESAHGGSRAAQKTQAFLRRKADRISSSVGVLYGALLLFSCYLFSRAAFNTVSVYLAGHSVTWTTAQITHFAVWLAVAYVLIGGWVFSLFGRVLPDALGEKYADSLAVSLRWITAAAVWIATPVTAVYAVLTRAVLGHDRGEEVTEEELMNLVDDAEEVGVLEETQRSMIDNIFEFDDRDVSEIMTHRTDIIAVEKNESIRQVLTLAVEHGCSRIPVYEEDLDNIKGIIHVKDLLPFVGKRLPKGTLADVMRSAYYVPESKTCSDLFAEMTEKHVQMAIVADEYGGTAGLVTMEDLLETIVGNMQDEYDDEQEDVQQLNETTFLLDGTMSADDAGELLNIALPEGEYDTVAGFLMSVIGCVPQPGEHPRIEWEGWCFTVQSMDERRIDSVKAERLPAPPEEVD